MLNKVSSNNWTKTRFLLLMQWGNLWNILKSNFWEHSGKWLGENKVAKETLTMLHWKRISFWYNCTYPYWGEATDLEGYECSTTGTTRSFPLWQVSRLRSWLNTHTTTSKLLLRRAKHTLFRLVESTRITSTRVRIEQLKEWQLPLGRENLKGNIIRAASRAKN